jgi:hypothetical protein
MDAGPSYILNIHNRQKNAVKVAYYASSKSLPIFAAHQQNRFVSSLLS